ncbi:MAG: hypothetical protein ACSHXD_07210 [Marinosulfonomonas sp.]
MEYLLTAGVIVAAFVGLSFLLLRVLVPAMAFKSLLMSLPFG